MGGKRRRRISSYRALSKQELAYAAGLLDGEGCIQIVPTTGKRGFTVTLSTGQTYYNVISWFEEKFGGSVGYQPPEKRPRRKDGSYSKEFWAWLLTGQNAFDLLCFLEPFMMVKGVQAGVAMEFWRARLKGRPICELKKFRDEIKKVRKECWE